MHAFFMACMDVDDRSLEGEQWAWMCPREIDTNHGMRSQLRWLLRRACYLEKDEDVIDGRL